MNKYGIVIGIGRSNPGENLGADNDARLLANILRSSGFGKGNVKSLINTKATLQAVREAVDWVVSVATPEDEVVFWFSGHGSNGWVLLGDNKAYHSSELAEKFSKLQSPKVFVGINSCYSGSWVAPLSAPNRIVRSSAGMNVVGDGAHYTVFGSKFLNEAIKQGKADYNNDGYVSIEEASQYCTMGWISDLYDGEFIF